MKINRSFTRALLMSVLAGFVLVSAGMATAGHLGALRTASQKVRLETTTCTPQDETDPKECEESDEGEEGEEATQPGGDEPTQPADPAEREAECNDAAGISASEGEAGSEPAEGEDKTTGLDHAIEVVLANCIKNPQAPGLLNALRHLVANRDRHLAHQAEKDARRAAREAAKAARQAARGSHGKGS